MAQEFRRRKENTCCCTCARGVDMIIIAPVPVWHCSLNLDFAISEKQKERPRGREGEVLPILHSSSECRKQIEKYKKSQVKGGYLKAINWVTSVGCLQRTTESTRLIAMFVDVCSPLRRWMKKKGLCLRRPVRKAWETESHCREPVQK